MAEFGWAYIAGGAITEARGPTGSIMLKKGEKEISGSANLTFNTGSNMLAIAGSVSASINISASAFYGGGSNLTSLNASNISAGNLNNARLPANISVTTVSASTHVSASTYYGDGSNLSGISSTLDQVTDNGNTTTNTITIGGFTATGNSVVTGSLTVSGSLYANELVTNVTNKNIVNISATGSTQFGDTTDDVHLFTGKVGIGTTTPAAQPDEKDDLVIGNHTGNRGMTIASTNTGIGTIRFARNTSANDGEGWIDYSGNTKKMRFGTNGLNTRMTINDVGNVGIGTGSPTKKLEVSGDIKLSGALSGSTINLTGLAAGTAATSSFLALDSNNNVVLTSSSGAGGGSGQIGAAEDGSYADGLYTDFTTGTPVGTAIDRFNEVLKILAPSPAPSLSRINYDNSSGITAKLSFGSSNVVSDYTSSNTTAGFSAVNVSQSYAAATSGNNFRLGVYEGTQDITGFLNFDIAESQQNGHLAYSNDAFGNAETGTLKLELNGTVIHSVSLSGLAGAGNPFTGSATSLTSDSGFTNVSVTASSFDGNNAEWYIFKHRTAKFKIDTNQQKVGWNYARVIHTVGGTDNNTNYIEWINDPSGAVNDLSATSGRIEDITLVGSKYLSGVQYNTGATAKYKVDVNNLYRNVYAASGTPVSFTVSNSTSPSSQAVPDINTGGGEDHTKILGVTASLSCNQNSLLSGSITSNVTVTHPFKSTISNTGAATTGNGFLIDNRTLASANLDEKFHDETYRITSGSYNTTASVTAGAATWNSETHMTGSNVDGHQDGLLFYNQRLYSPVDSDIASGGNFSAISNVSSGQPNYSGVNGIRTFYRKIQNTSGATKYDIKIITTKNSTTFNNSSLGTGNVHFFVKIPETTGWMDITQNFTYGSISDGDGALINGASNDVDSGNNTHFLTFGTASVAANKFIVLKIVADESWTGYLERLQFTMGASSETPAAAPALDDIDLDTTGTGVKLSFGSSNDISGFSNVQGGGIGAMSTINSNGAYSVSGDRRGVFTSLVNVGGTLNEDVGGHSNYSADSFFNGYSGSLVLEVNGATVHTVDLSSTLNALSNNYNGQDSGFNLSAVNFSTTSDDVPRYLKPYRTGTYQVGSGNQRLGWNYARVIHGGTTTNYVEWVVDTSGAIDNTAITAPVLSDFDHGDLYYQSGIKYFASRPSASFAYTASNFYSNVYSTESDAISFGTTTNCSISNIRVVGSGIITFDSAVSQASMPALNNNGGCETTTIEVTGTVLFDSLTSISGGLGLFTDHDVSVASTLKHPFKTNRTTSTSSKTSFMRYSGSIGSTNLTTNEYFNTEDYRIVSGNYANQADATGSANTWNSQTHMNGANAHGDGMVTINGYAISPFQIGKAGDTRNNAEGSTGLQAPSGNPNYSALSDNIRTYYRYFRNETGLAKATGFSVKLYGDANLCAKGGSFYTGVLGANKNINVELKVPFDPNFTGLDDTSTAWGDVVRPYQAGVQPTTDGVGIYSGGNSDLNQTVGGSGRAIGIQLLEKQIRDDQYFVLKISAHKDWTGYLSRIEIVY